MRLRPTLLGAQTKVSETAGPVRDDLRCQLIGATLRRRATASSKADVASTAAAAREAGSGSTSRGVDLRPRWSVRGCHQLHGATWPRGLSETTVGCAQRPAERLGEGDVASIVGSDVGAQLEGSAYQPRRGNPDKRDVDGGKTSVGAEQLTGPPAGFLVIADGVSQHRGAKRAWLSLRHFFWHHLMP